jgi:hypothetical protein
MSWSIPTVNIARGISEAFKLSQTHPAELTAQRGGWHHLADGVPDTHLVLRAGAGEPVTGPHRRSNAACSVTGQLQRAQTRADSTSGSRANVSASMPLDLACRDENLRRSDPFADDTR